MATAATPAFASTSSPARARAAGHAVFVQTDNTAGNHIVAYHRAADGTLTPAGSYATGGRGGILAGRWSTTPRRRARWPTTRGTACSTR